MATRLLTTVLDARPDRGVREIAADLERNPWILQEFVRGREFRIQHGPRRKLTGTRGG